MTSLGGLPGTVQVPSNVSRKGWEGAHDVCEEMGRPPFSKLEIERFRGARKKKNASWASL
jgi:hypothetical protein